MTKKTPEQYLKLERGDDASPAAGKLHAISGTDEVAVEVARNAAERALLTAFRQALDPVDREFILFIAQKRAQSGRQRVPHLSLVPGHRER